MKIKKVAITGFKSFMDRSEVPLPIGISGVVGPNGCGKSNIVDAIRWAMGEQSAKQLRGRHMEDIIFNGADDQKPMGMAEVSLTFENGDGSFPPPFTDNSELSITRRLFRSGESEYLINNMPCRLKDIQEVFMDTGLGNRAYSIIGQGRISSIVEQKPEETRAMLEEAAGITKYKRKVEETRRKIELTKGNLNRVEDILGEVQKQIRSLKRQASKAKRFKKISQEIQRLELVFNANTYRELKTSSGSKVKHRDDLIQEEVAKSATLSRFHAEIESMNLELEDKDHQISLLREEYASVKEKVNRKESVFESMGNEKRMQNELERRLEKEQEDLGRRLLELKEEQDALTQKVAEVRDRSKGLEENIALKDQRVHSRFDGLKLVKEEYEEARVRLNSGLSKVASLSQESGFLNQKIGEIRDRHARLAKEEEEVRHKVAAIEGASVTKRATREALAEKLGAIENDISLIKEERDERQRLLKAAETEFKTAEGDLRVSESRLNSLRSLTENFEGYKVGVRSVMKNEALTARREGRIVGLVADILQVAPEYEPAVEAVLGDKLQYIIVERQEDGMEAIEYLKTKAKGRSSFVPLKEINGNGNQPAHQDYPLLRDIIKVPDAYRPLIGLLAGNTALIPDLSQAVALWRSNGKDQCLVTPEGDVVDGSGVISGGKASVSSHGILARKREIRELTDQIKEYKQTTEHLSEKCANLSQEIEEKESQTNALIEERFQCRDKMNELDKTLFQISHELDQLARLSEQIAGDMDRQRSEKSKQKEALSRIVSELEKCKELREQEEEYLAEKEFELRESEKEYEIFREEITSLKMDYERSREEEKGLLREAERIQDFIHEGQLSIERMEKDIHEAKALYQEYLRKEEELGQVLKGLNTSLEHAEERVKSSENDRHQYYAGLREKEKNGESVREEIEVLREKINHAKMEQVEIEYKMNNLVEIVRDKYAIDLITIYDEYLVDEFSSADTKREIEDQKMIKERLGEVNLTAIQEHEALKERNQFITDQRDDLLKSIESLGQAIRKINRTCLERFQTTFADVDAKLKEVFPILFNGGAAGLKLTDETKPLEGGVLVEVRPPGKKLSHMGLLSGGEKALVAMALLFAIYLIKPSPFCLLDEVDAPLDEANIDRFNDLLKEIKKVSQVILVTHNRRSMEIVDRLFGVTMEREGVSKLVAVNLQRYQNN